MLKQIRNLSFAVLCALYLAVGGVPAGAAAAFATCSYTCGQCTVRLEECTWCEAGECTSSGTECARVCESCNGEPKSASSSTNDRRLRRR